MYVGDYVTILEKNNKIRFISGAHIGNNSYMATLLADDKCAMYEVLKDANIPVIEYELIWNRDEIKNIEKINKKNVEIRKYFNEHNRHIVLKPNRGYGGKMVYNIEKESQIEQAFDELIHETDSIAMNPYYNAKKEYRVVILNGEVRLSYAKTRGEGQWQFNLAKGGKVEKIESIELRNKLENLAMQAYRHIEANFICIDIFECEDGTLKILEINGSVAMEKYAEQRPEEYQKIKNIYKDAILSMFKEKDV